MIPAYGGRLSNIDPVRDRVEVNFSDVRDRHSMAYLVRGQDLIFSLAGQLSHIDSMRDPFTDLEINCTSQLSLLETCRRLAPHVRIIFASTRQLYGRPQYLPVDERHPTRPVDVNGVNKLAAEMYYSLYHDVYGMRTVNLRLTNTYGPRMDLVSNTKGFLGQFIRRALRGEPIQVFGDGRQRRDFNYVDDVVEALLLAGTVAGVEGRSFNLGAPCAYSLLEVVEMLRELAVFDYGCVPFPPDQQAIDIGDYFADFSAWRQATGWAPRTDLREGLAETLAFFGKHGDAYQTDTHDQGVRLPARA